MNYRHRFGDLYPSIRVDGITYTQEAYNALDRESRMALADEAVERCGDANLRQNAKLRELQEPHRKALKESLDALRNEPRFAERYRGRAADMAREEDVFRAEYRRGMDQAQASLEPSDGMDYPAAVGNVFHVWETMIETKFERFTRIVSSHDWYYHYSDAHNTWMAGEARVREMKGLLESFEGEEKEAAQLLFNQKCPFRNDDGSTKEENF